MKCWERAHAGWGGCLHIPLHQQGAAGSLWRAARALRRCCAGSAADLQLSRVRLRFYFSFFSLVKSIVDPVAIGTAYWNRAAL